MKPMAQRRPLRRLAWIWLGGGWMLNLAWEVCQGPLYEGHSGWGTHLFFCAGASFADVGIVAGLFLLMACAAATPWWYTTHLRFRLPALAAAGFVTAEAIELRALALGKWVYSSAMPTVPYVGVGLAPVLQVVLIPVVLALASYRWASPQPAAVSLPQRERTGPVR